MKRIHMYAFLRSIKLNSVIDASSTPMWAFILKLRGARGSCEHINKRSALYDEGTQYRHIQVLLYTVDIVHTKQPKF